MTEEERNRIIEEMYEDFADALVPTDDELTELLKRVEEEDRLAKEQLNNVHRRNRS